LRPLGHWHVEGEDSHRARHQPAVGFSSAVEAEFADFPLAALADRRTRGEFLAWRDRLGVKSRRQADYSFGVLARILSWAEERGLITTNPLIKSGKLYRASRADKIWTADDEATFNRNASPALRLALLLVLWTGQRQGDLLRLTWPQYDGERIRLMQGKTGTRVTIPAGAPLRDGLDAVRQKAGPILTTFAGTAWTSDGFRTSWHKACRKAGIIGITFHDLRGTAVTRLAIAGATEAEISCIR
jgi:integrase